MEEEEEEEEEEEMEEEEENGRNSVRLLAVVVRGTAVGQKPSLFGLPTWTQCFNFGFIFQSQNNFSSDSYIIFSIKNLFKFYFVQNLPTLPECRGGRERKNSPPSLPPPPSLAKPRPPPPPPPASMPPPATSCVGKSEGKGRQR
jgi:hypothetical protein